MVMIPFTDLQVIARQVGLHVVAVAGGEPLESELVNVRAWQSAGHAGEMSYMMRDAELLTSPARLYDSLRSIVVVGVHYDRAYREPLQPGYGRVARYAWGRDYHKVLRKRLSSFVEATARVLGTPIEHRLFSDSVPLLERALARSAGLGFIGKNTMLIMPRLGSFMFLGEVLWNVEVSNVPAAGGDSPVGASEIKNTQGRCGACSRCLDRCPTGAFVSEYRLDARRCISYLTIEKRTSLSLQERVWLGEWLFGCDVCQDVCPFNAVSIKTRRPPDLPELGSSAGIGQTLSLAELLALRSDREFEARFAGTPLMRAKRDGLLRNAAIVAANTGAEGVLSDLEVALRYDMSPMVRQHALWSHWEISKAGGSAMLHHSRLLLDSCRKDSDAKVRDEAERCLEGI